MTHYYIGQRIDTLEQVVDMTSDYAKCERECLIASEKLGVNVNLVQLSHVKTHMEPDHAQVIRDLYPSYWDDTDATMKGGLNG